MVRQDLLKNSKFVRDELFISQRHVLLIGTNIEKPKLGSQGGALAVAAGGAGQSRAAAGLSPVRAAHHGLSMAHKT